MATISIRFYYQHHVDRWTQLEAKGKIGSQQQTLLSSWRRLKATNPDMNAMEVTGGVCYPAQFSHINKGEGHAG